MRAIVLDAPALGFDATPVAAPTSPTRRFALGRINRWLFGLGVTYWGLRILFQVLHAGMVGSMRSEVEPASQVVTAFLESGARNDPGAAAVLIGMQFSKDVVSLLATNE